MPKNRLEPPVYVFLFLGGFVIAGLSEGGFKRLVRYLYTVLTDNRIRFFGKFELNIFNIYYGLTLGLYIVTLTWMLQRQTNRQITVNVNCGLSLLALSVLGQCYLGAHYQLLECTACDDGTRTLPYSDINYFNILLQALFVSLIPVAWTEIRARRSMFM